jgi:hypothetical protein
VIGASGSPLAARARASETISPPATTKQKLIATQEARASNDFPIEPLATFSPQYWIVVLTVGL